MIRVFRLTSLGWSIFSWCILGTLTADGINLDDLIPGWCVVHDVADDGHLHRALTFSSVGLLVTPQNALRAVPPPGGVPKNSDHSPRVVFDEDSPSVAAEDQCASYAPPGVHPVAPCLPHEGLVTTGALHLLNCAFLK